MQPLDLLPCYMISRPLARECSYTHLSRTSNKPKMRLTVSHLKAWPHGRHLFAIAEAISQYLCLDCAKCYKTPNKQPLIFWPFQVVSQPSRFVGETSTGIANFFRKMPRLAYPVGDEWKAALRSRILRLKVTGWNWWKKNMAGSLLRRSFFGSL